MNMTKKHFFWLGIITIQLMFCPFAWAKQAVPVLIENPQPADPAQTIEKKVSPEATQKTSEVKASKSTKDQKKLDVEPAVEQSQPSSEASKNPQINDSTQSEIQFPSFNSVSVQVDPGSGSASTGIPIVVSSGRGGIQPNLALTYNSNLHNGQLGVGWMVDFGTIQRSTKKGAPKYDSTDSFVLMQNGISQDLIYDVSTNAYHPEIEGAFSKIEFNNQYWTLTDRKGTKYYFGQTSASQLYDPSDSSKVFKWFFNKVEDIFGNYLTVEYIADSGDVYPQNIYYTGNSLNRLPTFAQVKFDLEPRSDAQFSYTAGFKVTTAKRINLISVFANQVLQSKYALTYTASPITQRSLLSTVNQYGSDGSALPAINFTYENQESYEVRSDWSIPTDMVFGQNGVFSDAGTREVDFNGDGYADALRRYVSGSTSTIGIFENIKNNGWITSTDWTFPSNLGYIIGISSVKSGHTIGFSAYENGVRFVDIDSDGWTDILESWHNITDGSFKRKCYLSNRQNGWNESSQWDHPTQSTDVTELKTVSNLISSIFQGVLYADINGDSFVDIINYGEAYLNNLRIGTTGWSRDITYNPPANSYTDFAHGATLIDLNGDGYPDIFYSKGGTNKLYLNTGHGWLESNDSGYLNTFGLGDLSDGSTELRDINGDGLTDVVVQGGTILFNTGTGWSIDHSLEGSFSSIGGDFKNLGTRLLDVNGDGKIDVVKNFSGQSQSVILNNSHNADLLTNISNGIGAVTSLVYDSSAHYSNTFLPFPISVVKSSTVSNAQGDSYTTQYSYSQGLWSATKREFRGFGDVKVIDPDGNYSETKFLQNDIYKGRISEQASYAANNPQPYAKTVNKWNVQSIIPDVNFVYLEQTDNYVYDGDSTGRRTSQEFHYDESPQLGNLTKTVQWGEVQLQNDQYGNIVDIPGDSRTVETSYLDNTQNGVYLLGIPKQTLSKDNDDQIVRQSWFYYDGHSDNNASPTQGLLTKKEDWVGDGKERPTTQYTYDNYGNLSTTQDPLGNVNQITYDDTYHFFPVKTKNAIGDEVSSIYYGVNDINDNNQDARLKGLWGQIKSTTDPNDQKGTRSYDGLGRMVMSISPLDSADYPTSTTEYLLTSTYASIQTHSRVQSGKTDTIDSISFSDGLGRLIQSKSKTENSGVFIVGGQTEYNSRGLAIKKYLPMYSTASWGALINIDPTIPSSQITYDAMGRAVRTTNPDGSYATIKYDDWASETIDENGHKMRSVADAYGRLIEKDEYLGADGRSSNYPYEDYTLYGATNYKYDSLGSLLQVTDAKGNETVIDYDNLGRKIDMRDPDMGFWQYEYDLNGNLKKQIDAKNQEIDFTYDALNRLVTKTYPVESEKNVQYTYDKFPAGGGKFKNPYGTNSITPTFAKGRLLEAAYLNNDKTQFNYDELGREKQSIKTVDGVAYEVNRTYDALNRLVSVRYPDSSEAYYAYNQAGQIEQVANQPIDNPLPPVTVSAPQLHFKLNENTGNTIVADSGPYAKTGTATTNTSNLSQPGKINQSLEFNGVDQAVDISSILSPISNDQTGSFSIWVNASSATGSIFALSSNTYDASITLRSMGGGNGLFSLQAYGKAGIQRDISVNAGSLFDENQWTHVVITQDGTGIKIYKNGILQSLTENAHQDDPTAWIADATKDGPQYLDAANIGRNCQQAPLNDDRCTNYLNSKVDDLRYYNFALDQNEINVLYNNGNGTEEETPSLDNGSGHGDAKYYISNIDYNQNGQMILVEYGNGDTTEYEYDPKTLRLTKITTINAQNEILQKLSYTYDPAGDILTITDGVDPASSQSFAYDELNRLTHAIGRYGDKSYEYDAIGNITKKDGLSYIYGENGAGPHAVTSLSDGSKYYYDANGNLSDEYSVSSSLHKVFTYDAENRLNKVEQEAWSPKSGDYKDPYSLNSSNLTVTGEYFYDGDGGRTKKIDHTTNVPNGNNGGGKKNIYEVGSIKPFDLHDFVDYALKNADSLFGVTEAEAQVVTPVTTTFIGNLYEITSANAIPTRYVFMGSSRIAGLNSDSMFYYHDDHLGSTNVVTDKDGAKTEICEYEPYGKFSRHEKYGNNDSVASFYFTGKQLDNESGLIYFGGRYYNCNLGRFITPDSFTPDPKNPQAFNRYSYVYNNPLKFTDPSGHFPWLVIIAILATMAKGAIIGAVIGALTAAATGGNIGMGALTGAIGGALFAGAGEIIAASNGTMTATMQAVTHVMAGGLSGGINSVLEGGSFGQGALIGGLSAGASKYAGEAIPFLKDGSSKTFLQFSGNAVRRSIVGAVIGGATSAAMGGTFAQGAKNGAISAGIGYAANDSLHDDGFIQKTWRTFTRGMNNVIGEIIRSDFGETASKAYKRGFTAVKTVSDIKATWQDSQLNNFEKIAISALQVGSSYVTVRASGFGFEAGFALGTPFEQGPLWGVVGATFTGAVAAEGGRMVIESTRTYFRNND